MNRQRIIGVHLLNDLSGSPFVFSQALQLLADQQYDVHLFTATPSGNGFLSGMQGVTYHSVLYRRTRWKLLTLLLYLASQSTLFVRLLLYSRKGDIVYINSMLPFGAALAGLLKRCRVVYHIHEVSIRPVLLKKWLLKVIDLTACWCIYVSHYCYERTPVQCNAKVIYNALPLSFVSRVGSHGNIAGEPFTVLMACSLRRYKGIESFVACATALPGLRFDLVLNASPDEIETYFSGRWLPPNLHCYEAQTDLHPFYQRTSLVVNLSLPDQWVETFGMTALEAMYYGKPVIVPPVGGITEIVEDGVNGFYVDSRRLEDLVTAICLLSENKGIYTRMSAAAYRQACHFTRSSFDRSVAGLFYSISNIQYSVTTPEL